MRWLVFVAALLPAPAALAGPLPEGREGWEIREADRPSKDLAAALDAAIEAGPLGKVNEASATVGAGRIGKSIPGNKVVGVFAPRYAVRMLDASVAAGIEAPLRFYIVERDANAAALAWERPSVTFAPYDDGGRTLDDLASELDGVMADIADRAAAP
ncbi:MAG: DUF302 domain-containing protein [Geminicoccaceae bacterium]|nr:DUF302 domain-containing protein [Geminicoccaceae bacterium]